LYLFYIFVVEIWNYFEFFLVYCKMIFTQIWIFDHFDRSEFLFSIHSLLLLQNLIVLMTIR
jgi:hypothetical protein